MENIANPFKRKEVANCWRKTCIGWRKLMRVTGFLIGLMNFIIVLSLIVYSIYYGNSGLRQISIFVMCVLANVTWIFGVAYYKPRLMLFSLIWYGFLAGDIYDTPDCSYPLLHRLRQILGNFSPYVKLVCSIVYILAMCCYDSIWCEASTMPADPTPKTQYELEMTAQANHTRDNIAATAPNESRNSISDVNTNDSRRKSLVMAVD